MTPKRSIIDFVFFVFVCAGWLLWSASVPDRVSASATNPAAKRVRDRIGFCLRDSELTDGVNRLLIDARRQILLKTKDESPPTSL
jgi:hypothetical protein